MNWLRALCGAWPVRYGSWLNPSRWTLYVFPPARYPLRSFSVMPDSPAAATSVGNQSKVLTMSFETEPGWIFPGQRIMHGTRNAPSQFVFFSLRNGVIAASGQEFMCGPLSVE